MGCYLFGAVMQNAAMDVLVQVFIRTYAFYSLRYIPGNGAAGSFCDPVDCSPPGSSVPGFPRQEYWNGLPFPSPGNLLNPGT